MKRLACLFSCVIAGLPCLCDAVPVHAYIVCGEGGRPMTATPLAVSNYVNRLNFDISYGDIYGLGRRFRYNQSTGNVDVTWDLFNVEVGFWRHGTRTPACN